MEPDPYIQFLENWIPGIGEDTKLHDQLHIHFGLGFSVNDEARLLGFHRSSSCRFLFSCSHFFYYESYDIS